MPDCMLQPILRKSFQQNSARYLNGTLFFQTVGLNFFVREHLFFYDLKVNWFETKLEGVAFSKIVDFVTCINSK